MTHPHCPGGPLAAQDALRHRLQHLVVVRRAAQLQGLARVPVLDRRRHRQGSYSLLLATTSAVACVAVRHRAVLLPARVASHAGMGASPGGVLPGTPPPCC